MTITLNIGSQSFITQGLPIDLAIPMHFNGPQPNTYGVPGATAKAYEDGTFVGDVRRGGGCNFESYTFVPHCNGTHTECIGHIAAQRIAIHEVLSESLIPATLITIRPLSPADTSDSYDPAFQAEDKVIDRASLKNALAGISPDFHSAIILRTLPNDLDKQSRDYMANPPAFFSHEAMTYLLELNLLHLLVDMPSVDRLFDEGKLSNHHIFWQIPPGSHEINPRNERAMRRTITEMVYIPDEVKDGTYMLELQVAPFMADAAPSRPRLWSLSEHA